MNPVDQFKKKKQLQDEQEFVVEQLDPDEQVGYSDSSDPEDWHPEDWH